MNDVCELVFDSLTPIEIPVTIAGKKYKLREASESAATDYRNAQLMAMRVNENAEGNRTATVGKLIETESILVSQCLFEINDSDSKTIEKMVPLAEVRKWPHRIVNTLFKKAEEISGLEKKETKEDLIKRKKDIENKINKLENQNQNNGTDDKIEVATSLQELQAKN